MTNSAESISAGPTNSWPPSSPSFIHEKAGSGILFASLLAGYAGPVVAVAILHQWPDWRPVLDAAHPLVSLLIGAAAPTVIPALLRGLARRADRLGGGE